jgi:hypothetical protein
MLAAGDGLNPRRPAAREAGRDGAPSFMNAGSPGAQSQLVKTITALRSPTDFTIPRPAGGPVVGSGSHRTPGVHDFAAQIFKRR